MAITVNVENYENYGRVLHIANAKQEMRVTIDLGPRIIGYNLIGKKNMMFNDIKREIFHDEPCLKEMFGKDKSWQIYGGHRFWVSPESLPESYYPDDEEVKYEQNGNVFVFTPPVQRATGWQEVIELTFDENDAKATLRHILTNKSDKCAKGAIWALSVTAPGGRVVVPMAKEDTGLLANRTLMLWPYNNMTDKRFYMDDDYLALQQDVNAKVAFKFGTNNTSGAVLCANNGTVFKKQCEYKVGAEYPDNGCSVEVYTSDKFLEMETLSPLYTMKPGESCEHVENWSLYEENSTELSDIVKAL